MPVKALMIPVREGFIILLKSQNHRIVGVGRDLCGSSRTTLKNPAVLSASGG